MKGSVEPKLPRGQGCSVDEKWKSMNHDVGMPRRIGISLRDDDVEVPRFPLRVAADIVRCRFGVRGEVSEVLSERDQVFKVQVGGAERFILRISSTNETLDAVAAQNLALARVVSECDQIAVPAPFPSLGGQLWEEVEGGDGQTHFVRLFTFVAGQPISNRRLSNELLEDIGRAVALVDKALRGIAIHGINNDLIFNIEHMDRLRPLVSFVEHADGRALIELVLDRMEHEVSVRLLSLPRQVIHNDLNGANILTENERSDRVSGIIDFGDLVEGAAINDLSVAIARQVGFDNTVDAAARMIGRYHRESRLTPDEAGVVFDLVRARLALRVLVWSWRKHRCHPRYHPGRIGDSLGLLAHWTKLGERRVTDRLVAALSC